MNRKQLKKREHRNEIRRENIASESRHCARMIELAKSDKDKIVWGRHQRGLRELIGRMG